MADNRPPLEQWEAARDGPPFEFGHHEKLVDAGDALAEAYRFSEDRARGLLHQIGVQERRALKAEAENKRLRSQQASSTQLRQASDENKRLRSALEWYADEFNYEGDYKTAPPVAEDFGQTAREALAEIEKEVRK